MRTHLVLVLACVGLSAGLLDSPSARTAGPDLVEEQSKKSTPVRIRTNFHWLVAGEMPDAEKVVKQQLSILNAGFTGTGFTFVLGTIDRLAVRAQGRDRILDVFVTTKIADRAVASFPWESAGFQLAKAHDHIRIKPSVLPGGDDTHYNTGKTLVHEVGHWLGLLHTYELGCDEPGDRVLDTPAQRSSAPGCPANAKPTNTCPNEPGENAMSPKYDPIGNPMESSPEACRTDPFTPNQISRMKFWWRTARSQ